jgi:hypothetical protein
MADFFLYFSDLLPNTELNKAMHTTETFLKQLVNILLNYIKESNDRNEKVLHFYHPAEMKAMLDLDIPEKGLPLQKLIDDCFTTLKYQVRTGKFPSSLDSFCMVLLILYEVYCRYPVKIT